MGISVVINTYNAEEHLDYVLRHLKGFDEIVVCDMESTDNTVDIATSHGCKVVTFPKGEITICEPARNFAIQSASNEWVLVVDADEIVTDELREYLYESIEAPDCPDALCIMRRNMMLDSFDNSTYPDYLCRFVRKSKTDWPAKIHSTPIIDGRVEYIPKRRKELALIHLPQPMAAYFRKLCTYTDNEAVRRKGKRVTFLKLVGEPLVRFIKHYVIKGGFLQGKVGYIQAQSQCFYRFMIMCKLYEMQIKERKSDRPKTD